MTVFLAPPLLPHLEPSMYQTTLSYWLMYFSIVSATFLGTMAAWGVVWLWRKARYQLAAAERTVAEAREEVAKPSGQPMRVVPVGDGAATLEPVDMNAVLAPPPMVGAFTLRDWLIHYTHRDDVWSAVVTDFYDAAAADPKVLAVFERAANRRAVGVDAVVAEVKVHFLRALVIVTHVGLTERLAARLESVHRRLGISGEVYDATIAALADVLPRYGVPADSLPAVARIAEVLKPRLVTA